MVLVYIDNLFLMKKLVYYLDYTNIKYTTDLNSEYDYILIAELNNNIIEFAKAKFQNGKKIIFLTYLEEDNIAFYENKKSKVSKEYFGKISTVLNIAYKVFVNFEFTKKVITSKKDVPVIIIPKEIPVINISKNNKDIYNKYKIQKRKKKILVIDENYVQIEKIYVLSNMYPKYNFIYVGYKPNYLLTEKNRDMINSLPKNVTMIKYDNLNIFSDLCRISNIVIFLQNHKVNIDYIYTSLLFKKQLIIKENKLFDDYFINSKNVYTFKTKEELLLKFKKMINERIANLSDNGYLLIKENTFDEIIKKYNAYLI